MDTKPDTRPAKGGDDELAGTVLMSGNRVVWVGPLAVLGTEVNPDGSGQPHDDDDVGEDVIATGELYTPPTGESSGER